MAIFEQILSIKNRTKMPLIERNLIRMYFAFYLEIF